MRRAEKEINDKAVMEEMLARAQVGRMATCIDNAPYITPVNFAHRGNCIYIHSAMVGRKVSNIKANPVVCFEVDEPLGTVVTGKSACEVSYSYRSLIISGRARLVEDDAEKREALRVLLKKFEPRKASLGFEPSVLEKTAIIEIRIEEISGKQSFPQAKESQ